MFHSFIVLGWCFFSVFLFVSFSALTKQLDCYIGPVLKEDLSHYKQKWGGQSNCCSCLRTLCQCQTVWLFGHCALGGLVLLVQKVSWIITLLQLQKERHFTVSVWVRFFFSSSSKMVMSSAAYYTWKRWSCIAAADFLTVSSGLLVLDTEWELINICSFYTAQGNNPVKEELCPLVVLSLEKIAKAPYETQEHHVLWWKNM